MISHEEVAAIGRITSDLLKRANGGKEVEFLLAIRKAKPGKGFGPIGPSTISNIGDKRMRLLTTRLAYEAAAREKRRR